MPDSQLQRTVSLAGVDLAAFLGHRDRLLTDLENQHPGVSAYVRGETLSLLGPTEQVLRAEQVVSGALARMREAGAVSRQDVQQLARLARGGVTLGELSQPIVTVRGKQVRPQTAGQRAYADAIDQHEIVFGEGPAGSGKTFLAIAKAVQALENREVAKIILTRPAVEAGERLGYLPGTLEEKIDPYLRPLFDAIGAMLDADVVARLLANGTIEVAPLAYMRGRTLNEAFVILDEAQNTTPEQLKMFLTRLGFGSRMVVTGDASQVDLPRGVSGLREARRVLSGVPGIAWCTLTSDDVVRNPLVGRIVDAYELYGQRAAGQKAAASGVENQPASGSFTQFQQLSGDVAAESAEKND